VAIYPNTCRRVAASCRKSSLSRSIETITGFPLTVRAGLPFRRVGWARSRRIAMIETVTALFGVVSVGIFLAHALEAYRWSRPQPALLKRSGGFSGGSNH
jgi:hypothetical protein